jgi:hypothetical protein
VSFAVSDRRWVKKFHVDVTRRDVEWCGQED